MFHSWLEQEKATIKSLFGKVRILCIFLAVMMGFIALPNLIILLDGGGVMPLCAVAFMIFVIIFALFMGDYKRRFIKPLLASIEQELPSEEAREEFARQMQTNAVCISYQPVPQTKFCDIMVAQDYCYMRQPGKSRIFKNNAIRKAMLLQENYAAGSTRHPHFRLTYALELYAADNEKKPVWKGYFKSDGELYQAFAHFKPLLPQDAVIQDNVAAGKTGSGRKAPLWSNILAFVLILAMIILAWATRTGRLG